MLVMNNKGKGPHHKTWLYEASGGCAAEELKAIKYFSLSWASPAS